jgi:signal peptidase I
VSSVQHSAAAPELRRPSSVTLTGVARATLQFAIRFAIGFAAIIVIAVTGAHVFLGYRGFTVLSGSMTPTFRAGDVIVAEKIAPLDARIGDIVSFRSPDDPKRLLTHRVIAMRAMQGEVAFVTRGDANTGVERWTIPDDGVLGHVKYKIPKIGYFANRAASRIGRILFLVVPALLLGILELRRIWRKPKDDADVAA